jgi:hypothetical protein
MSNESPQEKLQQWLERHRDPFKWLDWATDYYARLDRATEQQELRRLANGPPPDWLKSEGEE